MSVALLVGCASEQKKDARVIRDVHISGNDELSSRDIKKKIVSGEDPRRPLSDAAIVKILKAEGLQIARRTVAKYREELKIPSSSSRKQVFS